ncbi:2-succinyl-5-enolpyruvyl-6-hydroxy-3-cyclohexene-1-carboxylic-acid synthase [Arthrobacter sp. 35W]|uniref:2-succinyl-5-enolpyruvyl-6-hydroxy-3- cyclohexene-1-carboxylic-acid synthase n=1 Tax=Arthrobacter sp. 35W TaxID=1132441 RepID=UPI00054E87F1|nr:2-succinyl-5-enolpyruvyl-6-hydroxy-3-cyclohexene-1-carboxylic-acid synthase [Arthrobacter sp. 35W]
MDSARLVVDALENAGVRHVVVAPGSRSAPLAYALAEAVADGRLEVHVRIDERVAGFTALGLALGGGAPAAVVTTSGTAVGNLLPAVMEANHAGVPLVVLSADRPEELRGTGANQTTMQLDLFGEHVRFATDVPAGMDPTSAVATGLSAAQGRLAGVPAGPVQVNLAFRDPLTPPLDGSGWLSRRPEPGTAADAGQAPEPADADSTPGADAVVAGTTDGVGVPDGGAGAAPGAQTSAAEAAANILADYFAETVAGDPTAPAVPRTEHRTVVLAGHGAGSSAEIFARTLGLPLLAEPSSNARYGPNAVGPYRLLLEQFGPGSAFPIERVVVFGRPTLSRPVAALLARTDIERALYLPRPVSWFEPGRRPELVLTQWDQLAGFAGHGPDGWLGAWQSAAAKAEAALNGVLAAEADGAWEDAAAGADAGGASTINGLQLGRAVWARAAADPGSNLVLGSSNPIRDVDLAGTPAPPQSGGSDGIGSADVPAVFANRGLAGIDGTVATATGIALASGRPTRVLLGDLTLLHDAGALLLGTGERGADVQLVVLNDGGGGIFSLLEHGALGAAAGYTDAVERLFGTPQSADFAALAQAYGWTHQRVQTVSGLSAALAAEVQGRSIIEVQTSRAGLRGLHERVRAALLA